MNVVVMEGRLRFGERLVVSFHRTLRVPGQGGPYKLPPGLGLFAIKPIADGRFIVPVHSREAVWIGFSAAPWKPNAVKVMAGGINAVSGLPDDGTALLQPQNYMVCPDQPWLDGCNVGDGVVRQFVAMKLGLGYGLGANTAAGERGGLDILGFEPRPGLFPDAPSPPPGPVRMHAPVTAVAGTHEMTVAAGGRVEQKLYPDRHGRDAWDEASAMRARVTLVDARDWPALTGEPAPATPVDAAAYARAGLPWFALDDADDLSVASGSEVGPGTIEERDRARGQSEPEPPVEVDPRSITVIRRRGADPPE